MDDYQFKTKINEIKNLRGSGTELISLYIPPGKQIYDVTAQLRDEFGQCSNIKSKQTRTNVQSAISSIQSILKLYKELPSNGLAIFCGYVNVDHKQEFYKFVIEPTDKLQTYRYICDSTFDLNPLTDMLSAKEIYGLIVIDLQEATWGFLKGNHIESAGYASSLVPGKHNKGGQSSKRFERLRDIAIGDFYKKVGELSSESLLSEPDFYKTFKGLIVGGPGQTKDEFTNGDYLHHELKRRIIGTVTTSYTNEFGLSEIVDGSQDLLKDHELFKQKSIMGMFFKNLLSDKVVYGREFVINAIINGKADVVLISTDCANADEMIKCSEYYGSTISFISTDFEEGSQLQTAFGGCAAILRYA